MRWESQYRSRRRYWTMCCVRRFPSQVLEQIRRNLRKRTWSMFSKRSPRSMRRLQCWWRSWPLQWDPTKCSQRVQKWSCIHSKSNLQRWFGKTSIRICLPPCNSSWKTWACKVWRQTKPRWKPLLVVVIERWKPSCYQRICPCRTILVQRNWGLQFYWPYKNRCGWPFHPDGLAKYNLARLRMGWWVRRRLLCCLSLLSTRKH